MLMLAFPHHPRIFRFLYFRHCRNPEFSTNCKEPVYGGDSACPPEPPLRFAMVSHYLLWNYRSRGDAATAGAEALFTVAPKER